MTEDNEQLLLILAGIETGSHDDELDAIVNAVERRRTLLAKRKAATIKPGDTIRLSNCRPKYLSGLAATVVRTDDTHVWVTFPQEKAYRRYAGATEVRCHLDMIDTTSRRNPG